MCFVFSDHFYYRRFIEDVHGVILLFVRRFAFSLRCFSIRYFWRARKKIFWGPGWREEPAGSSPHREVDHRVIRARRFSFSIFCLSASPHFQVSFPFFLHPQRSTGAFQVFRYLRRSIFRKSLVHWISKANTIGRICVGVDWIIESSFYIRLRSLILTDGWIPRSNRINYFNQAEVLLKLCLSHRNSNHFWVKWIFGVDVFLSHPKATYAQVLAKVEPVFYNFTPFLRAAKDRSSGSNRKYTNLFI